MAKLFSVGALAGALLVSGVVSSCGSSEGSGSGTNVDPTLPNGPDASTADGGPTGPNGTTCDGGACPPTCPTRKTCAERGANCGPVDDGCGGKLDCGSCFAPTTCGAATPNVCTQPGCTGDWTKAQADPDARSWDSPGGAIVVDAQGGVHAVAGGRYHYRPAGSGWSTTPLPDSGWNVGLAVDAAGGLHLSYARQDTGSAWTIHYAYRAPGATTWTDSVVENVGSQLQDATSVAVDAKGGVYVRYLAPIPNASPTDGMLKLAYRPNGGTFATETVAPHAVTRGSTAASGSSLVVDASGAVHVAFFSTHDEISYATRPSGGTSWTVTQVDGDAIDLSPASLVVTPNGDVHVGYLGTTARTLKRAHKPKNGAWATYTVQTSLAQLFSASLAVDDTGGIHMTYEQGSLYYVRAKAGADGRDFYNVVDTSSEAPRVAVDRLGGVHVAYGDKSAQHTMRYAYRCPGACVAKSCSALGANCGVVHDGCNDVPCGTCSEPGLCGAGGQPHQCCVPTTCAAAGKQCGMISDGCGRSLDCGGCNSPLECGSSAPNMCGACVPGHFSHDTVYGLGNVGREASLTLDAQRNVHVAFADDTNFALLYGTHAAAQPWTTSVVDPSAKMVWGTAIAVDAQGTVHIVYSVRDLNALEIRYAYRASGATQWTRSTVATRNTSLSSRVALALGAAGALHAAYYDGETNTIVYATKPANGGWSTQTASTGGDGNTTPGGYGEDVAIALDAQGGVHLSHSRTDAFSGAIVHAQLTAGSWVTETVVRGSTLLKRSSIAVDAAGTVHVTYPQWRELDYAAKPLGGTFTTSYVANAEYADNWLAVDASGNVHVAYYDDRTTARTLMYALRWNGAWTTYTADTQKMTGRGPALALDPTGGVHIAYLDATNGDLKYAYRCP
jgi:hypothetical protein